MLGLQGNEPLGGAEVYKYVQYNYVNGSVTMDGFPRTCGRSRAERSSPRVSQNPKVVAAEGFVGACTKFPDKIRPLQEVHGDSEMKKQFVLAGKESEFDTLMENATVADESLSSSTHASSATILIYVYLERGGYHMITQVSYSVTPYSVSLLGPKGLKTDPFRGKLVAGCSPLEVAIGKLYEESGHVIDLRGMEDLLDYFDPAGDEENVWAVRVAFNQKEDFYKLLSDFDDNIDVDVKRGQDRCLLPTFGLAIGLCGRQPFRDLVFRRAAQLRRLQEYTPPRHLPVIKLGRSMVEHEDDTAGADDVYHYHTFLPTNLHGGENDSDDEEDGVGFAEAL
eukprot:GHVU01079440.1.p1 GENE.GHVU01079440.1~~GHVU01079440.1.p1  ORF type:complete len:337 (+),score=38.90 GHVU01079440.1:173-1183(+)